MNHATGNTLNKIYSSSSVAISSSKCHDWLIIHAVGVFEIRDRQQPTSQ